MVQISGRTFNAVEAGVYLGVHRETVLKAYRQGKLVGYQDTLHVGAPVRFNKEDLDTYRVSKLVRTGPLTPEEPEE